MLVNLTPDETEIQRRKEIAKEHGFEFIPQCDHRFLESEGIYLSRWDFNFPKEEFLEFADKSQFDNYSIFPDYRKVVYGVADSVEQIKEYYKEEIEDPHNKYCIAFTPVWQDKSKEGKGGGWRWHKWGTYIGKLNPQCEYLDDEDFGPDFKFVLTFTIYKV